MTQEDKELLFKDLCARLPYNVECEAILNNGGNYPCVLNIGTLNQHIAGDHILKPYLRPMSSMTEEEKKELWELLKKLGMISDVKRLDWLVAHHFDIRNLIEKGLALEALEGMYNIK